MHTDEERKVLLQKWGLWIGYLSEKGNFIAGDPVGKEGVIVKGKLMSVSNYPYKIAGETVGGYLLLLAVDIDEATEISKACPIFETDGSVEIRQIAEVDF